MTITDIKPYLPTAPTGEGRNFDVDTEGNWPAAFAPVFSPEEALAIWNSGALAVLTAEAQSKGWETYLLAETVNMRSNGPTNRLVVRSLGLHSETGTVRESLRFVDDRETALNEEQRAALGSHAIRWNVKTDAFHDAGAYTLAQLTANPYRIPAPQIEADIRSLTPAAGPAAERIA